jgi:hypothetical protein
MNLEPERNSLMPIPCIQIYHHLYDLDYDIMVKLTDYNDDAQNYFFQFPIRVLIQSNTPKQRPFELITTEPPTVTNENYCADDSKQYPFILYVSDAVSGDYLDGVNISYKCLNLECDIGQTKKPLYRGVERKYADPYLDEEFPYCYQGQVIAEMEGYHTAKMRINTDESLLDEDDMSYEELQMIPVKEFRVDVSSFLMVNRETGLGERVYDEKDGSIFATIDNEAYDFESQVVWPTDEGFLDTMRFLDMDGVAYNVSVIFMDEEFNLRGFLEIENWVPENIHQGNNLRFKIPSSTNIIEEDDYLEFYEYMQNIVMDEYLAYGINFR